jgi:hypothetical protein
MPRIRVLVLLLPLLLAGCYLTKETVIPPQRAEAIPGIEGVYKVDGHGMTAAEVEIVAVPGSFVYQIRDPNAACLSDLNASCEDGRMLSMHGYAAGKNRWVVEIWDLVQRDDPGVLLFIAFDGKHVDVLEPHDAFKLPESQAAGPQPSAATPAQESFAKSRGVTLPKQTMELTGPAAAVLAFLEAQSSLKFTAHRLLIRER